MKKHRVTLKQTQRGVYYRIELKSLQNDDYTAYQHTTITATTHADDVLATLVEIDRISKFYLNEQNDEHKIKVEVFATVHATDAVVIMSDIAFLTLMLQCDDCTAQEELYLRIKDIVADYEHFAK